ncbi:MAG: MMPL family transporter [Oscillospiraceae bacterium]|nr:MMPL family transporter [Oscillospiraceae bacterium]
MKRFYTGVVKHRVLILVLFLLAAVICLGLRQQVGVNYDVNDYLPAESASTVSLEVMEEEFSGGIPNVRVMLYDVTIPEALEYKERLEAVEGVTSVTWLDDAVDITAPLTTLDTDTVETYYKDGAALLTVTIGDEEDYIAAVDDIRAVIGDENAMTGSAVSTAVSATSTTAEVGRVAAFGIAFAMVVLFLTTSSWLEPFLVLAGLGIAVIINGGTNLMFGEISFVTNAAGSILQMAVSLDYSVFLLHRFDECREETEDIGQAMVTALCRSTDSILSSGLTTVIGFLALVLMRYRLGADLGLALAKGVAVSLITVFLFTPALLLTVYRLTDRLRHRTPKLRLEGMGRVIHKLTIPLTVAFALVIVPAFLASGSNEYYYGSSHTFGEDTQLGADTAAIEAVFGQSDTYVLLVPGTDTAVQTALSDSLHELEHVTSIISYVDSVGAEIPLEYLDESTMRQLVSENYSRFVISVDVPYEGEETFALVEQVRAVAQEYYPDSYYLAGQGVSTYDLMETIQSDMLRVNLVAIGAVFLVLLLTQRSVILPVLLVLCIETAIWINLAVPYFAGQPVFYIAYLIISAVQLGATVDYAILMTDWYRENRQTTEKREALVHTVSGVTVSILTSGSVLTVVGLLMGYMSSNQLLAQLGMLLGRGAIFSLLATLLILPGLLTLFDGIFIKNRKGRPGGRRKTKRLQKEVS